ncbi:MAG: prepilin-type N-terminal cleavage/methylation domain-containing protein [Planctomycetes bacterium]|nr:prepilin-type N-terminal cleavage/methylation domain-containing protein [Planctomycetota bacterium]
MKTPLPARRSAFTLIELIVVIGIMGVLAGLLLGGLSIARESAKKSLCSTQIRNVEVAIKTFETEWGFFPYDAVADFTAATGLSLSGPASLKERSNALLMFMLFVGKKSGPYIEVKEDDLDITKYTVIGDTYANITAKWNPKYTKPVTDVYAPLLLDPWGQSPVYDLNSPETTAFDNNNKNTRSFDIYAFGPNELDNEGDNVGTDASGINAGSKNDDINNWSK